MMRKLRLMKPGVLLAVLLEVSVSAFGETAHVTINQYSWTAVKTKAKAIETRRSKWPNLI